MPDTLRAAQEFTEQSKEDAAYGEIDFRNLGGLNAAFGSTETDGHLAAVTRIVRDGLIEAGIDSAVNVRAGGDEFGIVAPGLNRIQLGRVLMGISRKVEAYAAENGLSNIPNKKGGQPGIGIHFATSEIVPGDVALIRKEADTIVELRKQGLEDYSEFESGAKGFDAAAARPMVASGEQAVAPRIGAAQGRVAKQEPEVKRTGRDTVFKPEVHDLLDFVALRGGLDRDAMEREGVDPANWKRGSQNQRFFGRPVFRKNAGMTADDLAEALSEAGFSSMTETTPRRALELLDEALRGKKIYRGDPPAIADPYAEKWLDDAEKFLSALPDDMRSMFEESPELLSEALMSRENLEPIDRSDPEVILEDSKTIEDWLSDLRDSGVDQGLAELMVDALYRADVGEKGRIIGEIARRIGESRVEQEGRQGNKSEGVRETEGERREERSDVGASSTRTVESAKAELSAALGEKFVRRLTAQPWFRMVESVADLPPDIRSSISDPGSVDGFVTPDGQVYIVTGAIDKGEIAGVVLHEVGVHYGMPGVLGDDFTPTMRKFKRLRGKDARVDEAYARAEAAADREDGGLTPEALKTLDEEAVAYYVQANWSLEAPLLQKLIDGIKRLLNRMGIPLSKLNASPTLLRNVAMGAAQKAIEGGREGIAYSRKAQNRGSSSRDLFVTTRGDVEAKNAEDNPAGQAGGAKARRRGQYEIESLVRRFGGSVFADGLARDFRESDGAQLVGKSVKSAEDVAALSQVYRNPYLETMRYIFTDDLGTVVGESAVSSRMPASSEAFPFGRGSDWVDARAMEFGAKKVWLLHNHPSGDPSPSMADVNFTRVFANEPRFAEFAGHVVINHKKYSLIEANGDVSRGDISQGSIDPLRRTFVDKTRAGAIGAKIIGDEDVARIGFELASEKNIAVIGTDARFFVTTAMTFPPSAIGSNRVAALASRLSESSGGGALFVVVDPQTYAENVDLLKLGGRLNLLMDVIVVDDSKIVHAERRSGGDGGRRSQYMDRKKRQAVQVYENRADYPNTITIDGKERPTTDSTGKPIHIRNFWAWFGDSKVVDKQGRPLVVYHGTNQPIDSFSKSKRGANTGSVSSKVGFYFTQSPTEADEYSRMAARKQVADSDFYEKNQDRLLKLMDRALARNDYEKYEKLTVELEASEADARETLGDNIVPVYLSIQSPMVVDFGGSVDLELMTKKIAQAKKSGMDGLHMLNVFDAVADRPERYDTTQWVALEPSQIKSATGNTGTFSPTDKRIVYSRRNNAVQTAANAVNAVSAGLGVNPPQHGAIGFKPTLNGFQWQGVRGYLREKRRTLQDQMIALRDVQQDIAAQGGIINDLNNVYSLENLLHGRVTDQMKQAEDSLFTPLRDSLTENDIRVRLLEDYLEARFARQRNDAIAKINPQMPDGGSGMTNQEADDFLAGNDIGHRSREKLTPDKIEKLQEAEKIIREITAQTRKKLLDGGLISQELYKKLETQDLYVPLRHIDRDGAEYGDASLPGIGQGLDVRSAGIRRALGRTTRAQNIMGEILGNMQRAIITAEKNRVSQGLIRLALENPNPELWQVEKVTTETKFSEATGQAYSAAQRDTQSDEVVAVFVDGQRYHITLNPRLARAVKKMGTQEMPAFFQLMSRGTRALSSLYTTYAPKFAIVNPFRDATLGMLKVFAEKGGKLAIASAQNWAFARAAIRADMVNRSKGERTLLALADKGTQQKFMGFAREFFANGAATGYTTYQGIEEIQENMEALMKRAGKGAWPTARRVLHSAMEYVNVVNTANENAMRLAVYVAMRDGGASVREAAQYAKDLTVNFNRRGEAGAHIGAFYMFFNAAVQGNHVVLKLMQNKRAWSVMASMAAAQAALVVMGMADRDEETGERWWDLKISEYEKMRNFIIPLGGGEFIKIPLPYGVNVIPYTGLKAAEMAVKMSEGERVSVADAISDIGLAFVSSFSPIDIEDPISMATPSLVRPIIDSERNKSWTGGTIYPDQAFNDYDKPKASSYFPDTPEPYIQAARAINKLAGGDDYTKGAGGWITNWSPNQLQYLLKQYTGGPGQTIEAIISLGMNAALGEVPESQNYLNIANVVVSNPNMERAAGRAFRDRRERMVALIDQGKDIYETEGRDAWIEFQKKHADYLSGIRIENVKGTLEAQKTSGFANAVKRVEKMTKELNSERKRLLSSDMPIAERRKAVKAIDERIAELQSEALSEYNEE